MVKPSNRAIVWYDGGCPLCTREIALMRRLDRGRRLQFVDVSNDAAACPADRAAMLARFHVTDTSGQLHHGAAAFAAMWREIPLLRPLGHLARLPGVLSMLEWLYRRFLSVRPALQRHLRHKDHHG
ncbi:thiol-disulfide oxidoreductase DCC family protein [Sphingomonas sp. RS6]